LEEEEPLSAQHEATEQVETHSEMPLRIVNEAEPMQRGKDMRERRQEALSGTFPEIHEESLTLLKKYIREIGKQSGNGNRLLDMEPEALRWTRITFRAVTVVGDERVAILKRWGVLPGRAYQEIGSAIDLLLEEQRRGKPLLATYADIQEA